MDRRRGVEGGLHPLAGSHAAHAELAAQLALALGEALGGEVGSTVLSPAIRASQSSSGGRPERLVEHQAGRAAGGQALGDLQAEAPKAAGDEPPAGSGS